MKEQLGSDDIDSFRDYAPSCDGLRCDYVQEYYTRVLGVDSAALQTEAAEMKQQFIDSLPENQRRNIRSGQKQRSASNQKNSLRNKSAESAYDVEKASTVNVKETASSPEKVNCQTLSELYEYKLQKAEKMIIQIPGQVKKQEVKKLELIPMYKGRGFADYPN